MLFQCFVSWSCMHRPRDSSVHIFFFCRWLVQEGFVVDNGAMSTALCCAHQVRSAVLYLRWHCCCESRDQLGSVIVYYSGETAVCQRYGSEPDQFDDSRFSITCFALMFQWHTWLSSSLRIKPDSWPVKTCSFLGHFCWVMWSTWACRWYVIKMKFRCQL
jgi:hypothetical protein